MTLIPNCTMSSLQSTMESATKKRMHSSRTSEETVCSSIDSRTFLLTEETTTTDLRCHTHHSNIHMTAIRKHIRNGLPSIVSFADQKIWKNKQPSRRESQQRNSKQQTSRSTQGTNKATMTTSKGGAKLPQQGKTEKSEQPAIVRNSTSRSNAFGSRANAN